MWGHDSSRVDPIECLPGLHPKLQEFRDGISEVRRVSRVDRREGPRDLAPEKGPHRAVVPDGGRRDQEATDSRDKVDLRGVCWNVRRSLSRAEHDLLDLDP
jgi:hypothetical protein